ncbi:hypothetical protein ACHAQJ_001294 [Trichoderma viride]
MPRMKESKKGSGKKPSIKIGRADLQGESLLMQLPHELRYKIYFDLFSSTRFTSGKRSMSRRGRLRMASAPHGLAFLFSCRQAYIEIGKTWLTQVLFCFESPEAMLDKLAKITLETRSMIRNVRVSGDPWLISFDEDYIYYRTHQAFKLLPGLKLDRLTVLGPKEPEISYETLDFLIRYGDGWKELRYMSHASALLAYKHNWITRDDDLHKDRYLRKPQPAGWQQNLENRDSPGSGASVTIYRSTTPHRSGSVMHAATRVQFMQTLSPDQDINGFNEEDPQLMAPSEREKEMLVVVKRGRNADYEEKQTSEYLAHGDIRSEFPGKTWIDIKAEQEKLFADSLFTEDKDEDEALVDDYTHIDDYAWPPFHFST